jgi:SAM-dependent MidA family methyltransferase
VEGSCAVSGPGPAFEVVAAAIRRNGPIPFDRFLELALYAPDVGFYESGGQAGRRRGDFLTSPEVGPLFGAVLARALDEWWEEAGRPDPYVVVDAGAGPGTLGVAVHAAAPECSAALRYVLVERAASQRAHHGEHLSLSHPETSRSGTGPQFVSLADPPAGSFAGVVIANELLDNLPFGVLQWQDDEWRALHVGLDPAETAFVEVVLPASAADIALAADLVAEPVDGARIPIQAHAAAWLRTALDSVTNGRVVVLDYGDTTAAMAGRGGDWLRTYRAHDRAGDPLEAPGSADVTADVAVDQLERVRAPDADRAQAEFLRAHGLDGLVEEGRAIWTERAQVGDLEALQARSRLTEADALTDPTGLGAFRVLEWQVG